MSTQLQRQRRTRARQEWNMAIAVEAAKRGLPVLAMRENGTCVTEWDAASINVNAIKYIWKNAPETVPVTWLDKTNLMVIDGDMHGDDSNGAKEAEALIRDEAGNIPSNVVWNYSSSKPNNKGRQGIHFWFRRPTFFPHKRFIGLVKDVDFLSSGLIRLPNVWRPWSEREPDNFEPNLLFKSIDAGTVPELPARVLAGLVAELNRDKQQTVKLVLEAPLRQPTPCEQSYAFKTFENVIRELANRKPGEKRANGLYLVSRRIGEVEHWLPDSCQKLIGQAIMQACFENGFAAKVGERAVQRSTASGLTTGRKKPQRALPHSTLDTSWVDQWIDSGAWKKPSDPTGS